MSSNFHKWIFVIMLMSTLTLVLWPVPFIGQGLLFACTVMIGFYLYGWFMQWIIERNVETLTFGNTVMILLSGLCGAISFGLIFVKWVA